MNKNKKQSISRRDFLKSAVLGIVAVQIKPVYNILQTIQQEEIDVIGGLLSAKGTDWLEIENNGEVKRISLDGNTRFWRGGDSHLGEIAIGDDILLRSQISTGKALKVWSNLTRSRGRIIRIDDRTLTIQSDRPKTEEEVLITITKNTLCGNPNTDQSPKRRDLTRLIRENDFVDVIGEQTSDSIIATTVIYYSNHADLAATKLLDG